MEVSVFEGKNLEELIENSLNELNLTEKDVIINSEEVKAGLLKKSSYKVNIYKLTDIANYVKDYLKNIISLMGIEITLESKIRDEQIYIKMYSENNSLLIGKEGKNLSSLTLIVKQMLNTKYNIAPHLVLDVENYKEHKEKRIERLAKQIARDVAKTKLDVKLDNMNSYERRIVHNILSNNKYVYTISEGEEPNRHVIVKYKNDEKIENAE